MAVPTMIYYHPKNDKYGWLVGKFEQDTLKDHEQQFLKGKLPLRTLFNTPLHFDTIDCSKVMPEVIAEDSYDADLDAEILAEILAEQKAKERGVRGKREN